MVNTMTEIEKIDQQINQIKEKINDQNLCNGTAATWTRITGYYRAVEFFNDGKQQEFSQRLEYSIN
jgi:anaerobic ribonucleoside-triphosphate reductase